MSERGGGAAEALSDAELEAAFGGDLGRPGPGRPHEHAHEHDHGQREAPPPPSPVQLAYEGHPTWEELVHGWEIGIYRDPVLCGALAGAALGLVGVFVVLRRAVFVTAAISQAAGLGVALALYADAALDLHVAPGLGALVAALAVTALLGARRSPGRLPREALVGFVFVAASAGAVLVGDRIAGDAHDVAGILFGTAVLVRPGDLLLVAVAAVVALAFVVAAYRGLVFSGFDRDGARVQGLPVRTIETALWIVVALVVAVATRAAGALPVFAFAVLPALGALAVARRLPGALALASATGALSGSAGYVLAFFGEFPVGASQAVLATAFFGVLLVASRFRG